MTDLLALTADLPERAVDPGTALLVEGEPGGTLTVLVEGSVEVRKGDLLIAVVDEPGACLGELAVLLDRPHTATVVARTAVRLRQVDDGAARLRADPEIALAVATTLAHRLDLLNVYLADVRRQYGDGGGHLALLDEVIADLAASRPNPVQLGSDREPDPLY